MNPLKEYAKRYFRHFIKSVPPGIKTGSTLRIGMVFFNKEGKRSDIKHVVTVHKDEL